MRGRLGPHSHGRPWPLPQFDTNRDGCISVGELRAALKALLGTRLSQREVDEILQDMDLNGDGLVDFEGTAGTGAGEGVEDDTAQKHQKKGPVTVLIRGKEDPFPGNLGLSKRSLKERKSKKKYRNGVPKVNFKLHLEHPSSPSKEGNKFLFCYSYYRP